MTFNDEARRDDDEVALQSPRAALRTSMVELRRALSEAEVARASDHIVTHLAGHHLVRSSAQNGPIGVYWPVRGEPDVRLGGPDVTEAQMGAPHGLTLPGHPGAKPELRAWTTTSELTVAWRSLRYPADGSAIVAAAAHGIILVPALAFDHTGNRLGNGAGWYDRLLAGLADTPPGAGPLLVGVAHGFQVVDQLDAQPWDVPMDLLATPDGIIGRGDAE